MKSVPAKRQSGGGKRRALRLWLLLRAPAKHGLSKLEYRRERRGDLPSYPHEILFIAGLPKGGTNWIAQLLEQVPGYRQRVIRDWDRCMQRHDICDGAIESLPRGLYSIMRTHTRWSPRNVDVLRRHRIWPVVMHRDLRDQAVSRVYHVLNDPRHPLHGEYRAMSIDEAVSASIEVVIEHYVPWVSDWVDQVERNPGEFLELRYEQLHADPVRALGRVLSFYGIEAGDAEVEAIVETVRSRTSFGLDDRRLLTGAGTARKGEVGDWRNHFNDEHVRRFKRGGGELLIRLGHERDMEWTAQAPAGATATR